MAYHILILGGTGFLSSAIARASLAAGHDVTVLTRGMRSVDALSGARAVVADRSDDSAVREALQGDSFDLVIDAICFNADHARQDVALFSGKAGRLVMISTDFVYTAERRTLPVPESTPRDAPTPYGRQKAEAEDVLLGADDRLSVTVLRPPHIVGAGGLPGTGSLQGRDPALLARLRRGEPILLLDGGALLIQPVDRRDIAAACLSLISAPATRGRIYNIAGPEAVTTRRYYEILAEAAATPLTVLSLPSALYVRAFPERASFACHRAYSLEALARDALFRPVVPLETSLHEMVIWLDRFPPAGAETQPTSREAALLAHLEASEAHAGSLLSG